MEEPKFKVGDLVLYRGGLFRVKRIDNGIDDMFFEYCKVSIGEDIVVYAEQVTKADWRDVTRITKGGAQ